MSGERTQTAEADALVGTGRSRLTVAGIVSVLSGLLWLPQAWLAARVIDALIAGGGGGGYVGGIAGFVAVAVLRAFLNWWSEGAAQAVALETLGRLRAGFVTRESRRAVTAPAGEVASIAGPQVEMIRPYIARYRIARLRVMVLPMAILVVSFTLSWAVGLILLIAGPVIPLFMALVGHLAGQASRDQLDQMGSISATLADRAGALPDIRLLGAVGNLLDDFSRAANDLQRRTMRVLGIAFLSSTVLELFAALGVAMVAVFCGFSLLGQISFGTWGGQMTPATGLFLLMLAPEYFQPLRDLAVVWHDRAAADAAAAALAARPVGDDMLGDGARVATPLTGAIAFQGVHHRGIRYPDFTIAPGEAVAITGPSGSGKTTLLRLIAGLERPDEGAILVAGQPLHDARVDAWRAGLGWVPQLPHFLDATLYDNLTLGRGGDPAPALHLSAAGHVARGFDDGLAQKLGENGAGVSGGEARRLTLARALHGDPAFLIADEPTADLDAETAAAIIARLDELHRRGTGLIVATHDPALIAQIPRRIEVG